MRRIMLVLGSVALIGVLVWAFSLSGQATARDSSGTQDAQAPATQVCPPGCCPAQDECAQSHSASCQGGCEGCKHVGACKGGENCTCFVDADGDGKCDDAGRCAKHGEKAAAPKEQPSCLEQCGQGRCSQTCR